MEQPQITIQELISYIKEHCLHGSLSESVHSEIEKEVIKSPLEVLFGVHSKNVIAIDMITHIPECDKNLSLFSSILHCIHEQYSQMDDADKSISLAKFFSKWQSEVRKRGGLAKYTTPLHVWEKKELLTDLANYNITPKLIAFVAVYMNINIFVINEQIDIYSVNRTINKFKENLLLWNDKGTYKPLEYNKSKIWLFDDNPAFEYFIKNHVARMRIYQANTDLPPIEFKLGYDSDIHMIWSALEKEIAELKEQQAKYKKKPPSEDNPETTEQVMMEVMTKDTKKKIHDDDSVSHSSHRSKKAEPKRESLYTNEELSVKTCKDLKLLAKEHDIKTSIKVDGTSRPLNKQELVDKLLLIKP